MEKKAIIIYNPFANNNQGFGILVTIKDIIKHLYSNIDFVAINTIDIEDYIVNQDADIFLTGGDGTLNYVVNHIDCNKIENRIYYYPSGTGNDFTRDVDDGQIRFITLNDYIKELPVARIVTDDNFILKTKFINNLGYGLDGYVCEEGNRIKAAKHKPINYKMVAIKGLFYDYKSTDLEVEVDGIKSCFRNVWLAPTMNGRYCGGGMMLAPNQNRFDDQLSLVVIHAASRLKLLNLMPTIFDGTHVNHMDYVTVLNGQDIKASFDEPRPVQLDGEVVSNVTEYHVKKLTK